MTSGRRSRGSIDREIAATIPFVTRVLPIDYEQPLRTHGTYNANRTSTIYTRYNNVVLCTSCKSTSK
jgi:hypothetical protein